MKVPGSKIVPCQGVPGSNHSLTFGLFTQVSGSGPLGPLVFGPYQIRKHHTLNTCLACYCQFFVDHCDLQSPVILPYVSDPIKQEGMIF